MDKVFIKDIRVCGIIGVNAWEREEPQEILINITLYTDTRSGAKSDQLVDCLDYSVLAKKIQAHTESAARHTVEALADDLANICLLESGVQKVKVRVEKPGAVCFAKSVGVEIARSRGDYLAQDE